MEHGCMIKKQNVALHCSQGGDTVILHFTNFVSVTGLVFFMHEPRKIAFWSEGFLVLTNRHVITGRTRIEEALAVP